MFTGLIEAVARVERVENRDAEIGLVLATDLDPGATGASLAVDGTCLTVTDVAAGKVSATIGPETLARTTLGALKPGDAVNLERPVRLGERLGGHLVSGHVDAVGTIERRT